MGREILELQQFNLSALKFLTHAYAHGSGQICRNVIFYVFERSKYIIKIAKATITRRYDGS